jgi:hypothetical protein
VSKEASNHCFHFQTGDAMEHHWASDLPFTFVTNSAQVVWQPVLVLTLDPSFWLMPTRVQDVVPMTVMSSWCDLRWQGL